MKLVVVESPAKLKKIAGFLDADYRVVTCYGQVRDLPAKKMGIEITENNVVVNFVSSANSEKTLEFLRKEVKKASIVYLASDPDREGETIAYHLQKNLASNKEECAKFKRVTFNEITEKAVRAAIHNPREVDHALVAAQLSRRVIDRLVGFKVSAAAIEHLGKGVSVGRLQSVALKIVADRERQIMDFKPMEYCTIRARCGDLFLDLDTGTGRRNSIWLKRETANEIMGILDVKKELTVTAVDYEDYAEEPPYPFNTSTLQQAASEILGMKPHETMKAAQRLYECGLITYIRTDSVRVADDAVQMAHAYITKKYGIEYAGSRRTTVQDNAPDGHEAIRPTKIKSGNELTGNEKDLYQLILKRFIRSQMSACRKMRQTVTAKNDALEYAAKKKSKYADIRFVRESVVVKFDGYQRIPDLEYDGAEGASERHWDIDAGAILTIDDLLCSENQTQPPEQFTDATLVRELDRSGVGHPFTFATMVKTIKDRGYVKYAGQDGMYLQPTELGLKLNDFLTEHFAEIINENFTAELELQLDAIAGGKKWKTYVIDFDRKLEELVANASK